MIKSLRIILFIFTISLCNHGVYCQWRLNQISGEDGLSQNTIRSIIQDKNGFIWIGTYGGIDKYDGYSMEHFKYEANSEGLSSNIIVKLFEDKDGFVWAGTTEAGLNRINPDTGKIDVFFNNSAADNYFSEINNIYQAESGVFFINTVKGIKFFRVTDEGKLLFDIELTDIDDFDLRIKNIQPAINGKHWFLTPNRNIKLYQVDISDENDSPKIKIEETGVREPLFGEDYAVDFFEYPKNTIWVVSNKLRLLKLQLDDQLQVINTKRIDLALNEKKNTASVYRKLNMSVDKNNRLWIAGYGLLLNYDINSEKVINFNQNIQLKKLISSQQAQEILIDKTNVLWLGTLNNGLYKIDLENHTFFNSNEFLRPNLGEKFHSFPILSISEDLKGNIWLGNQDKGGISILKSSELQQSIDDISKEPWKFNYFTTKKKKNLNIPELHDVKRLMSDTKGFVWVGTKSGLSRVKYGENTDTFDIKTFDKITDNTGELIKNPVFGLEEDNEGNIWVGYWNSGLVKMSLDKENETYKTINYKRIPNDPNSLSNSYVRDVLEDNDGNIWVGTLGGLNKLERPNQGNSSFKRYLNEPSNKNSLSNNYVLDVFEARDGKLYVGTFGGGLNRIEVSKNNQLSFKHYTIENGLPSNVVYQIKEDFEGNIWMLHVREISKLNPSTGEIKHFEQQDGFSVNEFKDNAMIFTSSGIMLCGGVNGFTFFLPNNLSTNNHKPQLTITDFKLFDESVKPLKEINKRIILTKSINKTEEIVLPHNLNSMEFGFSSMHFSNPKRNKYKYILEGFNEKWQYATGNNRRFASYTNVPPGKYTFKVYGSNSAGIWTDEPKQIAITIKHPWYLTVWAIILFSLITMAIIYAFVKIRLHQIRLQGELELESALHEKSDEINQMKLQFFTNISHELRTPLTLIIGPLQQIMKGNTDPKYLQKLNSIMYKNSVRLLKLINQLLDFRKAESGNVNLIVQNGDLSNFIGEVFHAFEDVAIEKDIKFLFINEQEALDAWFDNDKVEKILYNLLSNAFKYTPKGKSIKITLEKETIDNIEKAIIKVIDYGMGIPKDELESVFERFYQAKKEDNSIHIGSGLGLAYTKHLVEIHKGDIKIESEIHEGTTCTFSIPISRSAYSNDSIIELQPQQYNFRYTKNEIEEIKDGILESQNKNNINGEVSEDKSTLLIVEDNPELQEYLVGYFSEDYNVLSANNGKVGLEIALEQTPEIIISDLMMPIMDGIEMCKKIKTEITTSHIPVVILTAKAGIENEKEGLETGADSFILKPFNIEILKLRVDNLLRTKQQWIKNFKTDTNQNSWKELSNKLDQNFIEKSIEIINKNMDNTQFSVEKFSLEIGLSRSALFKKIKSISGQSTSEFIRTIRLKKSLELLKLGKYSITEVIFMVGFSDPKYFRTCFKKLYDQTPSEYLKSFKNKEGRI